MKRNLKVLGLALVAVFALGAVAAQAALAVNHEFVTPGNAPTVITGEQDPTSTQTGIQVFTANGNAVECHKLHADGTQAEERATTVEVIPQYSENCHVGEFHASVTNKGNTLLNHDGSGTTGGCKYVFYGETTEDPVTKVENAPVSIQCETGKAIEIHVWGNAAETETLCTIKVGEKHGANTVNQKLHGVKYTTVQTEGKPKEVTLEAGVHGIKYTSEGPFCFLLVPSTGEATYEGKATVRAYEDLEPEGTGAQVATEVNP